MKVAKKQVDGFISELERLNIDYSIKNGEEFWSGKARKVEFCFPSAIDKSRAQRLLKTA
jgi:hypothetical protein